jgi:hypothetical protein
VWPQLRSIEFKFLPKIFPELNSSEIVIYYIGTSNKISDEILKKHPAYNSHILTCGRHACGIPGQLPSVPMN